MKRLFAIFLCVIPVLAVGPKLPRWLSFTASPSPERAGYYFYWRSTNQAWSDARRLAISLGAELTLTDVGGFLNLAKGQYWTSMTATNAEGSESDHSTPDFYWNYTNPIKPSNQIVQ